MLRLVLWCAAFAAVCFLAGEEAGLLAAVVVGADGAALSAFDASPSEGVALPPAGESVVLLGAVAAGAGVVEVPGAGVVAGAENVKKPSTMPPAHPLRRYPWRGDEKIGFGLGFDKIVSDRATSGEARQVVIIDQAKADSFREALRGAFEGAMSGKPTSAEYAKITGRKMSSLEVYVELFTRSIMGGLVRDRGFFCPVDNMTAEPFLHQYHYLKMLEALDDLFIAKNGPEPLANQMIEKRRCAMRNTLQFFAENGITSAESYDQAVEAFRVANPKTARVRSGLIRKSYQFDW